MTDRPKSAPETQPIAPRTSAKAEREARLAAALRENLRKRKAQARARAEDTPPPPPPAETKD
ncbi:hypothetical protein G3576_21915 [Roseomonas stagni]|uniref:Uncharacterized protein n=1 Tax=Falsiroseomonas algicola TaxID=2716930 RepID=A0A6M1LQK7_9PROT|nr:hypothetical protein [Falsiroseomonas algicola]NGM22685.1 hypothetical protein [Falsiroseomonas algicola]